MNDDNKPLLLRVLDIARTPLCEPCDSAAAAGRVLDLLDSHEAEDCTVTRIGAHAWAICLRVRDEILIEAAKTHDQEPEPIKHEARRRTHDMLCALEKNRDNLCRTITVVQRTVHYMEKSR